MITHQGFLDRVFKAIEDGKHDRAPSKIEENIRACLTNPDTNSARLFRASPPAWTSVRFAIDYDKVIGDLLERLDLPHITTIASKLEEHEACSTVFQQTFQISQRAKKRRAVLDECVANFSIPGDTRASKQPRLGPPPSTMPSAVVSDSDLQITGHQSNVPATLVPVETHETIDSTNTSSNSGEWPDAAILPSVFPQKLCDGVFKHTRGNKHERDYEVFACVTLSWQQDATQCSLDIGLTTDGASTVAGEIFQKRISYNKDKAVWVLTFDDGVEASMRPGDTFDRAQDLSMKPLLGKLGWGDTCGRDTRAK
ncbi:hypothetical protein MRS44_018136 [Fusarium solani]|uniref:uncharacterized protein n=1 Tax=Fusarium solani TaxID=169388 RepID=UPI0032C4A225|nr:hypothetical protein MRS44_018136 [Fusarium solani]